MASVPRKSPGMPDGNQPPLMGEVVIRDQQGHERRTSNAKVISSVMNWIRENPLVATVTGIGGLTVITLGTAIAIDNVFEGTSEAENPNKEGDTSAQVVEDDTPKQPKPFAVGASTAGAPQFKTAVFAEPVQKVEEPAPQEVQPAVVQPVVFDNTQQAQQLTQRQVDSLIENVEPQDDKDEILIATNTDNPQPPEGNQVAKVDPMAKFQSEVDSELDMFRDLYPVDHKDRKAIASDPSKFAGLKAKVLMPGITDKAASLQAAYMFLDEVAQKANVPYEQRITLLEERSTVSNSGLDADGLAESKAVILQGEYQTLLKQTGAQALQTRIAVKKEMISTVQHAIEYGDQKTVALLVPMIIGAEGWQEGKQKVKGDVVSADGKSQLMQGLLNVADPSDPESATVVYRGAGYHLWSGVRATDKKKFGAEIRDGFALTQAFQKLEADPADPEANKKAAEYTLEEDGLLDAMSYYIKAGHSPARVSALQSYEDAATGQEFYEAATSLWNQSANENGKLAAEMKALAITAYGQAAQSNELTGAAVLVAKERAGTMPDVADTGAPKTVVEPQEPKEVPRIPLPNGVKVFESVSIDFSKGPEERQKTGVAEVVTDGDFSNPKFAKNNIRIPAGGGAFMHSDGELGGNEVPEGHNVITGVFNVPSPNGNIDFYVVVNATFNREDQNGELITDGQIIYKSKIKGENGKHQVMALMPKNVDVKTVDLVSLSGDNGGKGDAGFATDWQTHKAKVPNAYYANR